MKNGRRTPSRILTDAEMVELLEPIYGYTPWWWLRTTLGDDFASPLGDTLA